MLELRLVGSDVDRSRSPQIHRVMLDLAALDGNYRAVSGDLGVAFELFESLRNGDLAGINVTMPFKERAADYCDWVAETARVSQSVNTMFLADGEVHGASSDAFVLSALRSRFSDTDKVLVLGSGGAASAAAAALEDMELYVSARRPDQARRVAERFDGEVVGWGQGVPGALLVNATPIGALGEALADRVVEGAVAAIDLAYGSQPTPLVDRLRSRPSEVVDGHQFLVMQAIKSFEWWTGIQLDFQSVWDAL